MLGLANRMSLSLGGATNGGGVAIASRNFTTIDAAGAQYWTIPTVTLTGDFCIDLDFALNDLTDNFIFISDSGADTDWFRIDAVNGGLDFRINNVFRSNDGQFTADNKLHNVRLERVGQVVTAYYDGVSVNSVDAPANLGSISFARLGARGGVTPNYFSGVIANLKIYDAGVLVRNYAINEADPSSIADTANGQTGTGVNITGSDSELFTKSGDDWLGAELWSDAVVTPSGDWSRPSAGQYDVNGSAGTLLAIAPALDITNIYRTTFIMSNNTSQAVRLGSSGYFITSGNGDYSVIGTDASALGFKRNAGTTVATLTDLSQRRILEGA